MARILRASVHLVSQSHTRLIVSEPKNSKNAAATPKKTPYVMQRVTGYLILFPLASSSAPRRVAVKRLPDTAMVFARTYTFKIM